MVPPGWFMAVGEYCSARQAFYVNPPVVTSLLLTGQRGAGKTSIVQAVAKSAQEDTRTLACTYLNMGDHAGLIGFTTRYPLY